MPAPACSPPIAPNAIVAFDITTLVICVLVTFAYCAHRPLRTSSSIRIAVCFTVAVAANTPTLFVLSAEKPAWECKLEAALAQFSSLAALLWADIFLLNAWLVVVHHWSMVFVSIPMAIATCLLVSSGGMQS